MGAGVAGALEQLASADVAEVAITELDIAQSPVEDYTAVVQACLDIAKCVGVTVWGVSDAVSVFVNPTTTNFANIGGRTRGDRARTLFSLTPASSPRPPTMPSSASLVLKCCLFALHTSLLNKVFIVRPSRGSKKKTVNHCFRENRSYNGKRFEVNDPVVYMYSMR
jgi:hypothetical protein